VIAQYEEHKRAAGVLDFVDLLVCARDLLVRDAAVRADLARRFTHYFVDEFQDTDPLQAEILMLLVADDPAQRDWRAAVPGPGRLFVVGDPKQSIYRFRRADVAIYEQIKERLVAHGAELCCCARASARARDPGGGERGVRARDAGRRRPQPTELCRARAGARRRARSARARGRARAEAVGRLRHGRVVEGGGFAARRGWRDSSRG
jgi:hypothetical protein